MQEDKHARAAEYVEQARDAADHGDLNTLIAAFRGLDRLGAFNSPVLGDQDSRPAVAEPNQRIQRAVREASEVIVRGTD